MDGLSLKNVQHKTILSRQLVACKWIWSVQVHNPLTKKGVPIVWAWFFEACVLDMM